MIFNTFANDVIPSFIRKRRVVRCTVSTVSGVVAFSIRTSSSVRPASANKDAEKVAHIVRITYRNAEIISPMQVPIITFKSGSTMAKKNQFSVYFCSVQLPQRVILS